MLLIRASGGSDEICEVWWGGKGSAEKRVWCRVSAYPTHPQVAKRVVIKVSDPDFCLVFHTDTPAAGGELPLLRGAALSGAVLCRELRVAAALMDVFRVRFFRGALCCWGSQW